MFIGLGTTCQTAYQLRRCNCYTSGFPLDWFITPFNSISDMIASRFSQLLDKENLLATKTYWQDNQIVLNTYYGVKIYHDFTGESIKENEYQIFYEKMKRRIQRFFFHVDNDDDIVFVVQVSAKQESTEYERLMSVLSAERKGRKYHLCICGHLLPNDELRSDISFFKFRKMPLRLAANDRWKGVDEEWDACIKRIPE